MNKPKLLLGLSALFLVNVFIPSVLADDIDSRIARQQGKIGKLQGRKKISAEQAARADRLTYKVTAEEQKMKTRHHGKLTLRDKAKLNRQLNRNNSKMN